MDLPDDNAQVTTSLPKQRKPLINPDNLSGMFVAFGVSLLIVALLSLIFGQRIGYQRGLSKAAEQAKIAADGEEVSAKNVKQLRQKTQQLQNQLTTAQQERDISLANLSDLRTDMQDLKITNLQLEQGREFLTTALSKRGGIPLQVIGAKIAPLPEDAYEYRFDVGFVDGSNKEKPLTPKLTLLDDLDMVEVPLEPKSYQINGIARIRGRFIMPKDFSPKQVKLELSSGGQKISQVYDWQLGQPVDEMPYSLEEIPETDTRPITASDTEATTTEVSTVNRDEVAKQAAAKADETAKNAPATQ